MLYPATQTRFGLNDMLRISVKFIQKSIPYLCLVICVTTVWFMRLSKCKDPGRPLMHRPVVFIGKEKMDQNVVSTCDCRRRCLKYNMVLCGSQH